MKTQRHKFHAVRCESDGKKFPSLLEKRYYEQLKLRQKAGEVVFFLRQVPFDLPGMKYVTDFQIFLADGTVEFVDTKGKLSETQSLGRGLCYRKSGFGLTS